LGYEYISSYSLEDGWKNIKKSWGHSLHGMCSRTGSFPPPLARYFIQKFSEPGDKVLDPFSGKGTAPLEACVNGRFGIGNDSSPEAYVLTHSKVKPVSLKRIKRYLKNIANKLHPLDAASENANVQLFFHSETLEQILAWRELLIDDFSSEGIFTKALMCGIIHGRSEISLSLPCSHSFSMSPSYVKRYTEEHNLEKPVKNVLHCLEKKAEKVLADGLPKVKGKAYHEDALNLQIRKESINLIVTSPPYFDKQTYAWDNWLRLWFLGHDYNEVRKKLFQTESKKKYASFMMKCLKKMYRVLMNDSACFIVIGDVKLKEEYINSAELLVEVAESIGFTVKRIINDPIPKSEKYFMFIPIDKGVRLDRILELHKGNVQENTTRINWNAELTKL